MPSAIDAISLRVVREGLSALSSPLIQELRYGDAATYDIDVVHESFCGVEVLFVRGNPQSGRLAKFISVVTRQFGEIVKGSNVFQAWCTDAIARCRKIADARNWSPQELAIRSAYSQISSSRHPRMPLDDEFNLLGQITVYEVARSCSHFFDERNLFVFFDEQLPFIDRWRIKRIINELS